MWKTLVFYLNIFNIYFIAMNTLTKEKKEMHNYSLKMQLKHRCKFHAHTIETQDLSWLSSGQIYDYSDQ